jgi:hypothetical protein
VLRRPALAAIPALLLATVALSSCGGSSSSGNGVESKSANDIVAAAKTAADGAMAVHVAGSGPSANALSFDLNLVTGKGGRGQLSTNGATLELVRVPGTVYIKGSPAFYRQFGAAAAQRLQGRWLRAPASSRSVASLVTLTDSHKLVDSALTGHGSSLKKGATTTINGHKVVGITDASNGGTLYVATTGKAYPIEIQKSGSGGKIVFDHWDEPISLSPPPNAMDLTKLSSGR